MAEGLHLSTRHRAMIEALLREHLLGVEVWAYGSRVNGRSHDGSDLDLVLRGPNLEEKPTGQLGDFEEAVKDSTIPFLVEARDWARLPERFHREIEREHVVMVAGEKEDEESRPPLNLDIANEAARLREILAYTRDGEWGAGDINTNLVPMRVIRGTDFEAVSHGSLANVPTRYIRPDVSARKTLVPWDILIETAGGSKNRPTGRTLLIHPRILERSEIPVTCASFARFLRIHCDRANPAYVYWFLQYLYSIGEMEKHQVQHTGVARFQFTDFAANIEVPLPPLPEQRAIAHILGTLDDKIDLNRRMNETLETMARVLFKSWFVDFDPVRAKMEGRDPGMPKHLADLFPSRLVDSELGEIPEGWEVKALGDLLELAYGKALKADNRRRDGKVPVYGSNGQVGWHDKWLAQGPGIVVGRKGNPGVVTWVATEFFPIDTTFYVVPKGNNQNLYFLFYALDGQDLPSIAADSAVPGLNRNLAYMNKQVMPVDPIVKHFNRYVGPIFARSYCLESESRTLALLRDTLLPKMISGEIRARDADRQANFIA